ncbi:hypothetical protein [Halochromatium roseum]|uniref:hypothetical protein n=1 Tax=Halochromatium roseum TaxID=391920 RepID=UPI0019139AE2|nr:hypothetical protein [Halochromatium roseum]
MAADDGRLLRRAVAAALVGAFLRAAEPDAVVLAPPAAEADGSAGADTIVSSLIIHPPTDTRGTAVRRQKGPGEQTVR